MSKSKISQLKRFAIRKACVSLLTGALLSLGLDLAASELVGTLPGEVVVTNTGAATYSIPIDLPKGVAGMTPELTIRYDSSAGNGLLGMGFQLEGLSVITRVPTTLEHDGFIDGIDFDENDRFSLDGQRLVCVSGNYGLSGSEYRTEIDSFSRIWAIGASVNGPDYFVVETKSGLTKYYGKTLNGSVVYDVDDALASPHDGAKVSWLLEEIIDSNGNGIQFSYETGLLNSAKYLTGIHYGSPGKALEVEFSYEIRNDKVPGYLKGIDLGIDQRLCDIHVFVGNDEIYKYKLNYTRGGNSSFSKLEKLVFTDVLSGEYLVKQFDWLDSESNHLDYSQWSGPSTYIGGSHDGLETDAARIKYGDFNGDGILDVYRINGWGTTESDTYFLSDGLGNFTAHPGPVTHVPSDHENALIQFSRCRLADFNGDGRADVYWVNGWGGSSPDSIYISDGEGGYVEISGPSTYIGGSYDGLRTDAARIKHGDFNGDGFLDVYRIEGWGTAEADTIYISDGLGNYTASPGPETYVPANHNYTLLNFSRLRLSDFNGDGLTDVYYVNGWGGEAQDDVYISDGEGGFVQWTGPSTYIGGSHDALETDAGRIKYGDFNGDGILDVYRINGWGTTESDTYFLSDGLGNFTAHPGPVTHVPASHNDASIQFSRCRLADFNGDGMTDVYWVNGWGGAAPDSIYISDGGGGYTEISGPSTSVGGSYEGVKTAAGRIKHGDFNGDGILDVYCIEGWGNTAPDTLYISDGLGNYTTYPGPATYVPANHNYTLLNFSRLRLSDFNGDGLTDVYYVNGWGGSAQDDIYILQGELPLLKEVTNNFAVSTKLEYAPLTDPQIYVKGEHDATPPIITVQDPRRVVSAVVKDSGMDDANGDPIPYITEYTYAEARQHVRGRGFLGFRVFESHDVQTGLTKTEILRHDFPFTGMKEATMTYSPNGQLLSRSVNELARKGLNLVPGADPNGDHLDIYHSFFPYFKTSEEWKAEYDPNYVFPDPDVPEEQYDAAVEAQLIADLEANAYGHTLTQNTMPDGTTGAFDAHGNLLRVFIDYGDGYTQETVNSYAYDNETNWFLGRLSEATVTSTAPDTTGQIETVIRKSAFTYDSNGLLLSETVEPVEPVDPLSVRTTYGRDAQGRIISTTVDPADGPAIVTETHSVLDPTGRFYTVTTNALGHSETRTYDPIRGWVASQTGPNGRTTHFQYDALGRLIREDRPDGTWSETSYEYDATVTVDTFDDGRSFDSVYKVITTGSQSPVSVTYYDRLGRAIRKASEHYDGRMVYQDTGFNALGQVDCVSENYYYDDESPQYWTKTTFDDLGRPDVAEAPDGTQTKTAYNGRETILTSNYQGTDTANPNANDQIKKTLLNAKGDKQTVTSYNQAGQPVTIDYYYDGVGNLLETVTTDSSSSALTVSMTYDIRGNKTGMVDPDMGTWTYDYNALGQLVSQTDAENNVTTKQYDALGRVVEETYDAAESTIPTVVHNFYYDGTGEFQQIGKLHLEKSSEDDGSGLVETFRRSHYYDDLGRSFLTLSKIEGRWFYQQTDYDSYSRPVRLTHYWRPPSLDDGLHDHYLAWYSYSQETLYDNRSFVTEVRDANGQTWWSDPEYNEHGQLVSYLAGNNLRTIQDFDDATHLVQRIHVQPGSGGSHLLDHSYQFDSIGNLTQRSDDLKSLTEDFEYDNLNRVTEAKVGGGDTLTIAYNDFGDISSRTSTGTLGHVGGYGYVAGTHRVSNAGGRAFSYNDNGAITSISGSKNGTIQWTAFNKPIHMEVGGKRSVFGYDSANSRVTQTRQEENSQGTWLDKTRKTYVGALFEQEQAWDSSGSKWDFAFTRIYISTPAGVVGSWVDSGAATPVKTVFHRDHLGSVVAESNFDPLGGSGAISKEFSYDAWGLARDPDTWVGAPASAPTRTATDRGYTGHEMLDDLGLVHMNGRIYDPLLGRMLSADPFIGEPTNFQNYNRYSYVTNNPLSMTDPSGFFFKKLFKNIGKFFKKFWKPIVAIALAVVTGFVLGPIVAGWLGYAAGSLGFAVTSAFVGGFVGGFSGALLNGGGLGDALAAGLKGGAIAGITAGVLHGLGFGADVSSKAETQVTDGTLSSTDTATLKFSNGAASDSFQNTISSDGSLMLEVNDLSYDYTVGVDQVGADISLPLNFDGQSTGVGFEMSLKVGSIENPMPLQFSSSGQINSFSLGSTSDHLFTLNGSFEGSFNLSVPGSLQLRSAFENVDLFSKLSAPNVDGAIILNNLKGSGNFSGNFSLHVGRGASAGSAAQTASSALRRAFSTDLSNELNRRLFEAVRNLKVTSIPNGSAVTSTTQVITNPAVFNTSTQINLLSREYIGASSSGVGYVGQRN